MTITKRIFDIFFAVFGLIVFFPIYLLIMVLLKIYDRGPVFFYQIRVGHLGVPFYIFKFRTMSVEKNGDTSQITTDNDRRITQIGQFLRRYKLDELPQLWNVLKGEMTFVGPRPEVRKYVRFYNEEQKKVLNLVPGITDLATIKYRRESFDLARVADPEKHYIENIIPDKVRINMEYSKNASLASDIRVIFQTLAILIK